MAILVPVNSVAGSGWRISPASTIELLGDIPADVEPLSTGEELVLILASPNKEETAEQTSALDAAQAEVVGLSAEVQKQDAEYQALLAEKNDADKALADAHGELDSIRAALASSPPVNTEPMPPAQPATEPAHAS